MQHGGRILTGRSHAAGGRGRPRQDDDAHTKALYIQAIRASERSIRIENACVVPPPEVKAALIDAARRGVKVEVLTNGAASFDIKAMALPARHHYDDLVAAGVRFYETKGGTLHAKTAVFDEKLTIAGSVNLNGRSDGRDSESAVLIYDGDVARQNLARFGQGVANATEVTAADLAKDSPLQNLKERALSLLSWMV